MEANGCERAFFAPREGGLEESGKKGDENEKKRIFSAHGLARCRRLARPQSIREVRNCNRPMRPLAVWP